MPELYCNPLRPISQAVFFSARQPRPYLVIKKRLFRMAAPQLLSFVPLPPYSQVVHISAHQPRPIHVK